MKNSIRLVALAAAVSAITATLPLAAQAGSYQTASFVDESVSAGDYFIDSSRFLGATFKVASSEKVSMVGGNFTQYGDGGTLFAAIVAGNGKVLAETLFTPTGGEQSVALDAMLAAGSYSVVFGSGLYGATGSSGLVSGQNAIGTPSFVQYGGTLSGATAFTGDTLRVTMLTSAVPEPSTALLWAAGMLSLGLLTRRRTRG